MGAFIGRADELAALEASLAAARAGSRPTGVVVRGDAGIGKSRLLAESLARASALNVVRMTGFEPERTVPLATAQPLLNALLPDPASRPVDPLALFELAHASMAARVARAPFVLVLDDAQWADERSLALIHYLVRGSEAGDGRLGLLLATRPHRRVDTFLASLRRLLGPRLSMVELGPLAPREALQFAAQFAGAQTAAEVARRAEGNPFWMEALARAPDHGDDVNQLIEGRLRTLAADEVEILLLLAITARPIPANGARAALGWPAARVEAALGGLTDAGLVRGSGREVAIGHDLIREAILPGLPAAARARLHRRLAAHLERSADGDLGLLVEALEHHAAAGDAVAGLAIQIAEAPDRRLLDPTALRRLAAVAERLPAGAERRRLDAGLARLADELGDHEFAVDRWQRVISARPSPRVEIDAALAGARSAIQLGSGADAKRFLKTARSALARRPEPARQVEAAAVASSIARWLDGDPAAAAVEARAALAAARRLPGVSRTARAARRAALRVAHDSAMQRIERRSMLQIALELSRDAGADEPEARLSAGYLAGVAHHMGDQPQEAVATLSTVWTDAGHLHLPRLRAEAGYFLAMSQIDIGHLREGQETAVETASLLARIGGHLNYNNRISTPLALGEILLGEWPAGLKRLRRDAERNDDPHSRMRTLTNLALWDARMRGGAAAGDVQTVVARALADAAEAGCSRCGQETLVVSAEAAAAIGDMPQAAALLAEWEDHRPAEANAVELLHRACARARLDTGPATLKELDDIVAWLDTIGRPVDAAWLLLTGANLIAPDDEGAKARAVAAHERAQAAGAVALVALATQRLRRLGVRTWRGRSPGDPIGPGALSRREMEVGRRLAAGETNAEIAVALFLSPRTVDRHVENILRKLGARNRAAAAAAMRDQSMPV